MSTPEINPDNEHPALPPVPAPAPAATLQVPLKSPGLAFFLSLLFPGIGQVYNGQPAKALAFFFAFVASIYAVIVINPLPFAFFIPFVVLYNMVDAWRSAALINARGTPAAEEDVIVESPAWGAGLVLVGLLFLLHNLHWLDLSQLGRYWPVLLIAAGAVVLYRSIQKGKGRGTGDASPL
jgi:TM2 domain-containing membrane protein YozV